MEANPTILIVEDEGFIAMDLQQTLVGLGYRVDHVAATAAEALRYATESRPDLAIMDIHLRGEQDGIEAATRLRDQLGVPVVYLTAYADAATMERARATDPLGYVPKPFSEAVLRTTLAVAFRLDEVGRRLRAQQQLLSTTLRCLGEGVIGTDTEGRITLVNAVAEALTGWSLAEVEGQRLPEALPLIDEGGGEPIEHPLLRVLEQRVEARTAGCAMIGRDRHARPIESTLSPILDDRGGLLGAVMVLRDVSEARLARQQLELSHRMVSLGTMAAGIAHEINNPLAFVTANIRYALDQLAADPAHEAAPGEERRNGPVEEALQEAESGGNRIAQIVSDLTTFARPAAPLTSHVELVSVLRWALSVTSFELRQRARISSDLAAVARLPAVIGNEGRLGQVFINLLMNAAQAITPGDPGRHEVKVAAHAEGEGWVVVEVSDSGPGMKPEVMERIFEPFFTTKPVGRGSGLGLSISHGIVTSTGGTLTVASEVGRGTTFRVRLPVANPRPLLAAEAPVPPARRRVLVIDDEPMILRLIERILGDGHQVTSLGEAEAALALLARGERFDVILCDLAMPHMTGLEFLAILDRDYPEQAGRLVFVSGNIATVSSAEFLAIPPERRLEKPFDHRTLRSLIARIPRRDEPPS